MANLWSVQDLKTRRNVKSYFLAFSWLMQKIFARISEILEIITFPKIQSYFGRFYRILPWLVHNQQNCLTQFSYSSLTFPQRDLYNPSRTQHPTIVQNSSHPTSPSILTHAISIGDRRTIGARRLKSKSRGPEQIRHFSAAPSAQYAHKTGCTLEAADQIHCI